MFRIFGKVWYYLTLWAWSITALIVAAVIWTAVAVIARRLGDRRQRLDRAVSGLLVVIGAVMWTTLVVQAATVVVPEAHLSRPLGAVVGPTVDALEQRELGRRHLRRGVERRCIVRFSGLRPGERTRTAWFRCRRCRHCGGSRSRRSASSTSRMPTWSCSSPPVPISTNGATSRVRSRSPRTSRGRPQSWRSSSSSVPSCSTASPSCPIDADRYDALATAVDFNLFSVQTDPAVPIELQRIVDRMLKLGQETAVFLVPPDVYD